MVRTRTQHDVKTGGIVTRMTDDGDKLCTAVHGTGYRRSLLLEPTFNETTNPIKNYPSYQYVHIAVNYLLLHPQPTQQPMGKSLQWILIATVGHVFHISKTGPKMLVSRQIGTMAFILNTRRHPRVHLMKKPSTSMQHWHRPLHTKYSQSWSDETLSSSYYCSSIPIERDTSTSTRIQAIHNELNKLGIDAEEFESAVERSMSDKDDGYDIQYGRSAIRAYRSFVYSRLNHKLEEEVSNNNNRRQPPPPSDNLQVAAIRFARQIDFLIKRHKSHITDWVRHTDDTNGKTYTSAYIHSGMDV